MSNNAQFIARNAKFNNCHVLTVSQDWYDNGKPFWALFYGTDCNGGFRQAEFRTRREAIALALDVVSSSDYPFTLAWQHGLDFHWIDVDYYRQTKIKRKI